MANITSKERIRYIDNMKGFAMLCVVLGHVADGYLRSNYYPANVNCLFDIYNVIYSFHMPLFFMISGYLYQRSYWSNQEFPKSDKISRQLKNLLIIYVEFSFLLGIFKILGSKYVNTSITWKQLLFIGIKTIPPYWYLYVLIAFYLLYWIKPIAKCQFEILLIISLCMSLFSGLISNSYWFEIKRIMYYMLFWNIGFLRSREPKRMNRILKGSFIMGIFALIVMRLFWNAERYICQIPIVNTFVALGCCLCIWNVFEKSILKRVCDNRILQMMGKYCLEIYVLHCFLTAGNRVLLKAIGMKNFYISIVLNLIISIMVPIILAKIAKKINIYNLIFRPSDIISRRKL